MVQRAVPVILVVEQLPIQQDGGEDLLILSCLLGPSTKELSKEQEGSQYILVTPFRQN